MFELKIFNTRIVMNFSFFATIAILILISDDKYILLGLYCCIIHELGHLAGMYLCKCCVKAIIFTGGGIRIIPEKDKILSYNKDIFILMCGPFVNLCLSMLAFGFGRSVEVEMFACINILMLCFNLLPFKRFDGGEIIRLLIESRRNVTNIDRMKKLLTIINLIIASCILVLFYLNGLGNFTILVTVIYLIIAEIYF